MKSKIIIFVFGLAFGAGIFILLGNSIELKKEMNYIQLKKDYKIEGAGYLKQGTILKVDQPMDEGFTRYILYLNLNDGETTDKYKVNHQDEILPYWLMTTDSTK